MVGNKVTIVPEHVFRRLHVIGGTFQDVGDEKHAIEIWDMLVAWEYKVLVYHNNKWKPGVCTGTLVDHTFEQVLDPEAPITYDIEIEGTLVKDVAGGQVIIRADVILRLQSAVEQARRDLQTLVGLQGELAEKDRLRAIKFKQNEDGAQ